MKTQRLVTICRSCGREFEPTPAAIRLGKWKACPQCRDQEREDRDNDR